MPPAPIPSKPWTNLGCDPLDLVKVVSNVIRGDTTSPMRFFREEGQAVQVVEMLAARHRVGPFLYAALEEAGTLLTLPQPARERLLKSAEAQAAATSLCLSHVSELHGLLGAAGCPFLLLKGPELGIRFGRGAAARGYRDVDVLVPGRERARVCGLLEKSGYIRLSHHFLGSSASAHFNHGADYVKDGQSLDLHWSISRLPGVRIDADQLFDMAHSLEIVGKKVMVAYPPDELGILLVSTFADIQRGYLRLQTFVDIASVAAALRPEEWEAFFVARLEERTEAICRTVLHLVVSIFNLKGRIGGLDANLPPPLAPRDAMQILLPSPGGRVAKRWALRHLPVGLVHYATWWVASLPFRAAASHPRLRRVPSQPAINSANRAISGLA